MNKLKKNMIASAVLVLFSLFMLFYAIPEYVTVGGALGGSSTNIQSDFFPRLTSIVIGACITAMALSLVIKIYHRYGTLDTREIRRLHG